MLKEGRRDTCGLTTTTTSCISKSSKRAWKWKRWHRLMAPRRSAPAGSNLSGNAKDDEKMERDDPRPEQQTPGAEAVAPSMAGDVTIARFLSSDADEKWRVTLGRTHFVTDQDTAKR